MRSWGPALALAVGAAAGNACLIELDHVLACGDGYADPLAGEECDPLDEDSFVGACAQTSHPNGEAACDPKTCKLIKTAEQCAKCGDGIIDFEVGEECDGSNIGVGCWGDGSTACTNECKIDFSACAPCGNKVLDPGEECDGNGTDGGIVLPRNCAGSPEEEPLRSPFIMDFPYTSGTAATCLPNCTFDRTSCGYCGNGVRNDALLVSLGGSTLSMPEICDGDLFDSEWLANEFPLCEQIGAQANVECAANCLDVSPREGPACCIPKNEACPADGDSLRCCYEYAHPEADDYCFPVILPPNGEDGGESSGGDTDGGNANVCR